MLCKIGRSVHQRECGLAVSNGVPTATRSNSLSSPGRQCTRIPKPAPTRGVIVWISVKTKKLKSEISSSQKGSLEGTLHVKFDNKYTFLLVEFMNAYKMKKNLNKILPKWAVRPWATWKTYRGQRILEEILNEKAQMMTPSCGPVDMVQQCFHLL